MAAIVQAMTGDVATRSLVTISQSVAMTRENPVANLAITVERAAIDGAGLGTVSRPQ
jgi:hypothetical protein